MKLLSFAFCIMAMCSVCTWARATDISSDSFLPSYDLTGDVTIASGVLWHIGDAYVRDSVSVINNGTINTVFHVCDGCELFLHNRNSITATFDLGRDASVYQVINTSDDLNPINGADDFSILVRGNNSISWNAVRGLASGADKIILDDAVLMVDADAPATSAARRVGDAGPEIELVGDVIVRANSVDDLLGYAVFSNAYGDGAVFFVADDVDPLYMIRTNVVGDDIYAELVRETDYLKIFNNKTGEFLNMVRAENPNSSLMSALDRATTMGELTDIMNKSIRFNPMRLMRPVRMFNSFEISGIGMISDGLAVRPTFIFSDDVEVMGANLDAGFAISDNTWLALSGHVSWIDVADAIDEYSAVMYGGNLHLGYDGDLLFARLIAGMSVTDFDTGIILSGDDITENPRGVSVYGATDVGIKLRAGKFVFAPFLRGGGDYVTILDASDFDSFAGVGGDVSVRFGNDISYEYGFGAAIDTRGVINADVRMNIMSVADGAGGNLGLGIVYDDDFGVSYKVRVGAGFIF